MILGIISLFILAFIIAVVYLIVGCIKSNKPTIKTGLRILFVTGIVFVCLVMGIIYITKYKIHEIDSSVSPIGSYELKFQQVGDPDFPFGHTHVRLLLKDGKQTVSKHRFDVANDGGNMNLGLWNVTWKDGFVEAVISGEEQQDYQVMLYFDGDIETSQLDTKYGKTEEERWEEMYGADTPAIGEIQDINTTDVVEPETDADGYPLSDEYQEYKTEIAAVAGVIDKSSDLEIQYAFTAKGIPYAVLFRESDANVNSISEYRLILNEAYEGADKHEYVLEKYEYDSEGSEISSPVILGFYLIDSQTLKVTDEKKTEW